MRRWSLFLSLVCAAATAGCDDFATPAELVTATVVGIVADPPVVAPGEATTLTPLIASPQGPLPATGARWSLTETLPGVAPFGAIVANSDGSATYRAPAVVPPLPPNAPPVDSVRLELALDGRATTTIKAVLVAGVTTANPVVAAVTADGGPIMASPDAPLELAAGQPVELEVTTTPAATDQARYAWYASLGVIEAYQSNPCSYVAATAGTGWLYVVVRDGQLGVAWRAIPIVVR